MPGSWCRDGGGCPGQCFPVMVFCQHWICWTCPRFFRFPRAPLPPCHLACRWPDVPTQAMACTLLQEHLRLFECCFVELSTVTHVHAMACASSSIQWQWESCLPNSCNHAGFGSSLWSQKQSPNCRTWSHDAWFCRVAAVFTTSDLLPENWLNMYIYIMDWNGGMTQNGTVWAARHQKRHISSFFQDFQLIYAQGMTMRSHPFVFIVGEQNHLTFW